MKTILTFFILITTSIWIFSYANDGHVKFNSVNCISASPSDDCIFEMNEFETREKRRALIEKKMNEIRTKHGSSIERKLKKTFDKKLKTKTKSVNLKSTKISDNKLTRKILKNISTELTTGANTDEKINSITLDDNILKYSVTLLNIPNANGMLPDKRIETSNMYLKQKYCTMESLQKLREINGSLFYSYFAANGDLLYEIRIQPFDCEQNSNELKIINMSDITDGCNSSPYSNACTVGPKNYGIEYGDPHRPVKIEPAVTPPTIEENISK